MNIVVNYIVGALISCGLFFAGRYLLAHPDRIVHLYRREERPAKSAIAFVGFVGNFLLILGAIGAILYLFLILSHLIGRHG